MKNILSRFIILLSILLIQSEISSASYWQVVHTVAHRIIWNIAYADENTIYAAGDSVLMKSTDGGYNWTDLLPNVASITSNKTFFNVSFVNKDTGFVYINNQIENLLLTTDGGSTWSDVSPSVLPWGMLDVEFVNQSIGYAVGGFAITGIPDSIIARTIDGGHTWTHIPKPTLCTYPMAVHFLTDSIGFTGDEQIYKTIDAGTTWTLTTTPAGWPHTGAYATRITDYKFFDNQIGFAITDNWAIYKTIDGGDSWELTQLPVSGGINGCRNIAFDQNNFGYVVGFGLFQPFVSPDAGKTWLIDGTYSAYYPASCISVSKGHKIIIGTREGDVVLKENSPLSSTAINDLSSTNIYPNPSSGTFYLAGNDKLQSIEVYNLLGDLVYKRSLHLNNNKYEVMLTDVPKGLYVIKINNATNSIQRKLQLE